MALQWLTDPNIQVNGRTPDDIYINGTQVAHLYKNVKITACHHSLKMFKNQSIGYEGSEAESGIGCDPDTDEIPGYRDYYVDIVTGVYIKVETDVTQSDGVRLAKVNLKYYTTIGKYQYNYNYSTKQVGQQCSIDWEPAANDVLATADITQEEFNTLYNTYGEGVPTANTGIEIWKNFPLYKVTGTSWNNIPAEDWTQTFKVKMWARKDLTLTFTDGTTQMLTWTTGWTNNQLLIDTLYASSTTHSQTYNK
jgi:hypothetical protein